MDLKTVHPPSMYMTPLLSRIIGSFMTRYRPSLSGSAQCRYLFVGHHGKPLKKLYGPVTRTTHGLIGCKVSPHQLRALFISHSYTIAEQGGMPGICSPGTLRDVGLVKSVLARAMHHSVQQASRYRRGSNARHDASLVDKIVQALICKPTISAAVSGSKSSSDCVLPATAVSASSECVRAIPVCTSSSSNGALLAVPAAAVVTDAPPVLSSSDCLPPPANVLSIREELNASQRAADVSDAAQRVATMALDIMGEWHDEE